jgi:hypothetical protein
MIRKTIITVLILLAATVAIAATVTRIQVKRGPEAQLPATLASGEPAMTTDTHRVFFGFSTGKVELLGRQRFEGYSAAMAYWKAQKEAQLAGKVGTSDPRLSDARTPLAHTQDIITINGLQSALDGKVSTDDSRLSDARTPLAHTQAAGTITGLATVATSGSYNDLTGKPALFSGAYGDLSGLPSLFSGSYSDLTNKPATFPPSAHNQAASTITGLATVATSGSYNDLSGKPSIPAAQVNSDWASSSGLSQILNRPSFTRGYDGHEVEVQNNGTYIQWRYAGATSWNNLIAVSAITGSNGTNGTNGKTVLNGTGAPSNGLGTDGDFYLDTANAHLYGPKASGAWPGIYVDLVGPQGVQGPPGPAGNVDNAAVRGALDDPIDGVTVWVQQGPTEQATNAKIGVKDTIGNAKQWVDGNGTMVRQCITADSAPAFKMISSGGAVIYSVACDNTMTFTGAVTIK